MKFLIKKIYYFSHIVNLGMSEWVFINNANIVNGPCLIYASLHQPRFNYIFYFVNRKYNIVTVLNEIKINNTSYIEFSEPSNI